MSPLNLGARVLKRIFESKENEILSTARENGFEDYCRCGFLGKASISIGDTTTETLYVPICLTHVLKRYSPEEEIIVLFHGMDKILYRGRNIFLAPKVKLRRICEGYEREGAFQCPYGVEMPDEFFELGELEFYLLHPSNALYVIKQR